MNEFRISEASKVYWEADNDGLAVYVIAKHPDGWTMRVDAPNEIGGNWLTMTQRKQWAKDKVSKARLLISMGGEA